MWIYGYEDYKQENKNGNYDRVIIFHLLRSDVTLTIKDGEKYISQNVKCKEFYSDIITEIEQERVTREKSIIKFFAQKNLKQLIMGIPVKDIINNEKGAESIIIKNEKLIVSKIEYARDKVIEEIEKRDPIFEKKYPKGNKTIRFYVTPINEEKKEYYTITIHTDNNSIKEIWSPGHFYEELKITEYFCHKYFELLCSNIPIEEILKKDDGEIIICQTNLSRKLSENTIIQKVLTKLKNKIHV